jgi:DNA-directed RNA polymerase subunit RPC12/RpoP
MEKSDFDNSKQSNTFGCVDCGADLKFTPGTASLSCEYCGATNEIPIMEEEIVELDYEAYLANASDETDQLTVNLVKCQVCAAESTLEPHITSASCPYCDTPLIVADAHEENILKPKSLLPFKIKKEEAIAAFKKWINKLWFAPNALKKAILSFDHFKGIYLPFWTYDSNTSTSYTGQRGRHYYVSESYTTTENGKTVSKTRQVRKTSWTFVTGHVHHAFDDVLVPASNSLPAKQVEALEPWDLENLVPFTTEFLSGFITEKYQVNLKSGFDKACTIMNNAISSLIQRDIGGDDQRILTRNTQHKDITFKHLLLPAYVSAYNFKSKLYRFMVNARTGEVQGERPYSWIKITLAIVLGLAIIGAIYLAAR